MPFPAAAALLRRDAPARTNSPAFILGSLSLSRKSLPGLSEQHTAKVGHRQFASESRERKSFASPSIAYAISELWPKGEGPQRRRSLIRCYARSNIAAQSLPATSDKG